MANLVLGVFDSRENASTAIDELKSAGYSSEDISVLTRDTSELNEWREEQNVADDAAKGAATGGVVGALAGLLIGAGIVTLPPLGAIVIAGPIAAALGISTVAASGLAGAGLGALGGGLVAALRALGLNDEDATRYSELITSEGILVGVERKLVGDQTDPVEIFGQNGAVEVREVKHDLDKNSKDMSKDDQPILDKTSDDDL